MRKSTELEEIIESVRDNLINGNLTDAFNAFKELNQYEAAYVAVQVIESTDQNTAWLVTALRNAS